MWEQQLIRRQVSDRGGEGIEVGEAASAECSSKFGVLYSVNQLLSNNLITGVNCSKTEHN